MPKFIRYAIGIFLLLCIIAIMAVLVFVSKSDKITLNIRPNDINCTQMGIATQSSTYNNNNFKYHAEHALDEDKSTYNHTNTKDSWWQLDFPLDIDISTIVITNQHDMYQNRLNNFDVIINNIRNEPVYYAKYKNGVQDTYVFDKINVVGRMVKILLKDYLHMSNVKVFGNPINKKFTQSIMNIATPVNGTASQSTTKDKSQLYAAVNALMNTKYTHSNENDIQNPWWQFDFNKSHLITKIKIINREDCCQERLNNFNIKVYDINDKEVYAVNYNYGAQDIFVFNDINIVGSRVKLTLVNNVPLHLSLVKIYGN